MEPVQLGLHLGDGYGNPGLGVVEVSAQLRQIGLKAERCTPERNPIGHLALASFLVLAGTIRPMIVKVTLSDDEMAAIHAVRGAVPVSAWIRGLVYREVGELAAEMAEARARAEKTEGHVS
jgi:hypothetical protein